MTIPTPYTYSLYGFYKHAIEGPPNPTSNPSIMKPIEYIKWEIWKNISKKYTRDEAWYEYLSLAQDLSSSRSHSWIK